MLTKEETTGHSPAVETRKASRLSWLLSPLWLCLLVAIAARTWLVVHTHGVIDGDEAIVGIQAGHILRGELPIYYYGQAYMGSLQAYLVALIFAVAGSSVWTLRAEPILLSLVLVYLTWRMAAALADYARLGAGAKKLFMTIAAIFAALPPLYDMVIELRTWGGHIEIFVISLWLLWAALRLTQRWSEQASRKELAWRWTGVGLLSGIGLWVNPLIVYALPAISLWISCFVLFRMVLIRRSTQASLQELWPIVLFLLGGLIGIAPALYWGYNNKWQNITYLLNTSAGNTQVGVGKSIKTIAQVGKLYATCTAPRIFGGALPTADGITAASPQLLTLTLLVMGTSFFVVLGATVLSFFRPNPVLVSIRRLTALPLVFAACVSFVFCVSKISAVGLVFHCGPVDLAGRYATPLLIFLPFIIAAPCTLLLSMLQNKIARRAPQQPATLASIIARKRPWTARSLQIGIVALLFVTLFSQGYDYAQAHAGRTFQTSGCVVLPQDYAPVIEYMQREHITYAWATFWMGYPIIFMTHEQIIVVDPRVVTNPGVFSTRLPEYKLSILRAERPSVLTIVRHNDSQPALLQALDAEGITYRSARLPAQAGSTDVLIITPLNRAISPFESHELGATFGGC